MKTPKISIVVPVYLMDNALEFTQRNLDSIRSQSFTDYEIIVSDDSEDDMLKSHFRNYKTKWYKNPGVHSMASNSNYGISKATGEIIKILYQDDYFYTNTSLEDIDRYLVGQASWLVSGCVHNIEGQLVNEHMPFYSESDNTIGSPSVLAFKKEVEERFDPQFHWTLDLDLYKRLYRNYGKPKILNKVNVVIGIHKGQKTNLLSDERKRLEHAMLKDKFEKLNVKL